ncbi:MAG: MASE1 domain-containing protein [Deltaproteobacteria bacterium]|nr:MASE1 domain-containing protein [Deltaproteobacteria bacterium]
MSGRDVALIALLATAYVVTGRLGLTLAYYNEAATLVWAPSGLSVAALWLGGRRMAVGVFIGAFVTNYTLTGSASLALGLAVGNTAEALAAEWLVRRTGLRGGLRGVRDVVVFVGAAVAAPTVIAAVSGVACLAALAGLPGDRALTTAMIWWLGDAGGVLVVTPLLLAFAEPSCGRVVRHPGEGALIAVLAPAIAAIAFGKLLPASWSHVSLALLPFPVLVWAAVRFGMRGATAASALVTAAAVIGTAAGTGPFRSGSVHGDVASLWTFLATMSLSAMLIATSLEEREAEAAVRRDRERWLALVLEASESEAFEHDLPAARVRTHRESADAPWVDHATFWSSVHPEDRALLEEAARACARGEREGWDLELRVCDGDAEKWMFERARVAPSPDGRPVRAVGLRGDVTARHQERERRVALERELERSKRLAELGMLAGGVAHDFNNLLTIIRANAELARVDGGSDQVEALLAIDEAATRAAELTDQLLAYAGRRPVRRRDVDVAVLAAETLRLLRPTLPQRVSVRVAAGRVPLVDGDPAQLRQVLMNLLLNAVQAIEDEGRVHVRVGAEGAEVIVAVEDDGRGMDEHTAAQVFQPFFTTKPHGRGLGMSAVAGIVRAHAGQIRIESRPGQGTTVSVRLPATDRFPEVSVTEPLRLPEGGGLRVLVVDDEQGIRSVARTLLTAEGWDVTVASDAREAQQRVNDAGPFDVVLLDVTLPDGSGVDVHQSLRARDPSLPVVLMSGYSDRLLAGRALDDVRFLQKPFRGPELLGALREAIAARSRGAHAAPPSGAAA